MSKSKIEWTDAVWNPVTGCSKVSEGCRNCYAERMSKRLAGRCGYPLGDPFRVTLHPDKLGDPLKWRKNRMVFVNSMSDLFHDDISNGIRDEIFGVMLACRILNNIPDHTFQILTKRPKRMHQYFIEREPVELLQAWSSAANWITLDDGDMVFDELVYSATCRNWDKQGRNSSGSEHKPWGYIEKLWPLPNVWLGVSVENQAAADERIPLLLQTPAAVRFISAEPLLGPINLTNLHYENVTSIDALKGLHGFPSPHTEGPKLDWVIVGGESGPGARPMHPTWVRSLRDQCKAANVPFFFKQWGEWGWFQGGHGSMKLPAMFVDGEPFKAWMVRVGKKKAGRELDGRTWDGMPGIGGQTC